MCTYLSGLKTFRSPILSQITNESLGRGSFSVCYKCLERSSGKFYAVKIISKASRVGSPVAVEIENLRKCLGFKHVVQLHETLDDDEYDYMVMELLKGGELFDRIKSKTKFTELAAAEVMAKIVEAVKSIHAIHIAHRDIKPENLLYDSESDSSELKLIDFGFSKSVEDGSLPLKTPCFTAAYAAPEVLKNDGEYDMSCDLWSVGVIMYTLLCGYPPFNVRKKSDSALYDTIVSNGEFKFKDEDWRDVSSAARDLIQRFLDVVPSRRISAKEALAHPWFNEIRARSNKRKLMALPSSNFLDAASVTDNIEAYRKIIPKLQMSGVKDSAIAKRRKLKHLSESGESGTEGNTPTKLDTKPQ
ncbi:serine/threonine protein kinase [Sphaeroforma arctica JP610]|uniref:Serine/threonine protein kinase n=1 Tax=Sphaeroforma arctica JP610 TaxID=667725 RepID=A0A0L0FG59_9EUKA|nr:serine/threonine protein kinase [Sphaeroforma arctica JP610]KNC75759.1 serine/threonine protein kinase [Sphaeroforma arctica JP610]|eukprot:XP_014149661.1 serine/threonine protein kinase [Sphaeroforma arctica JP610]